MSSCRCQAASALGRRVVSIRSDVSVPTHAGWRMKYEKLRRRGSFEFPILGVAAAVKLTEGLVEDVNEMRVVKGKLEEVKRDYPNVAEVVRKDAFRRPAAVAR